MATRLKSIRITNFGPFYGEQLLSFGSHRPIVLVYGDNMRGKTSLVNAVRWGLYGVVIDRFGQPVSGSKLVNWDAQDSSDWTMSVEVCLDVNGTSYALTRSLQPQNREMDPNANGAPREELSLSMGGQLLTSDDAQAEVNRVLPERVSCFFLFDGERLNEYEVLLSSTTTQAQLIRESIEDILGVPVLTNTIADVQSNLRRSSRQQRNQAKKDQAAKEFAHKADEIEAQIEQEEKKSREIVGIKAKLRARQKHAMDLLQISSTFEADTQRLHELEGRIERLRNEEARLADERRTKVADVWSDILDPLVQGRLPQLESEREEQIQRLRKEGELESRRHELTTLSTTGECPVCGQLVNKKIEGELLSKIKEVEQALVDNQVDPGRLEHIAGAIYKLRAASNLMRPIEDAERALSNIRTELAELALKQDDLRDRLNGENPTEAASNRRVLESVTKDVSLAESTLEKKQALIVNLQAEASKLRETIGRVSGPNLQRLNREVKLYEGLHTLFQQAIEHLRKNLREAIERDATEIFLRLTSDKSYSGLRINERYGLAILDNLGREVEVRSAGAEQIVALALIGALYRNAVCQGPVIMDSPLGRLDLRHRDNILKFVPTMTDQIILLAHGGEVDRARDLEPIKQYIDKEYQIEYRTSRRSEIVLINS